MNKISKNIITLLIISTFIGSIAFGRYAQCKSKVAFEDHATICWVNGEATTMKIYGAKKVEWIVPKKYVEVISKSNKYIKFKLKKSSDKTIPIKAKVKGKTYTFYVLSMSIEY